MMTSFALLVLLACAPGGIAHADADAVIASLEGTVQVRPFSEKKYIKASPGFPLAFGDQVRTGRKAIAHVEFPDQTVVLVKEGAIFTIEGTARRKWMRFSIGEFLVGLKRSLQAGESFEVRTPSAVASVRGTLFWGLTDAQKNSVWSGFGHKVAITAGKKTIVLEPGQTVKVPFGGVPGAVEPSTVSKAFINTFAIQNDLRGLDGLTDPSLK